MRRQVVKMLYLHTARDDGLGAYILDDYLDLTIEKVPGGLLIEPFTEIEALSNYVTLPCYSACLRSLILRKTITTPVMFPLSSLIALLLVSTGNLVPSWAINTVLFACSSPVVSLMILKTSFRGFLSASSIFHPVTDWATGFMNST